MPESKFRPHAQLIKYVADPKPVKEGAKMPAFKRIKEEDLRTLAEFLASLKG